MCEKTEKSLLAITTWMNAIVIENKILDRIALVIAQGKGEYDGNICREYRGTCCELSSCPRGPLKVGELPRIHEMVLAKPDAYRATGQR